MKSEQLIQELIESSRTVINAAETLRQLNPETLRRKPNAQAWCILECLEHLNRYSEFYNPQIASKIALSKTKTEPEFKSTWMGNYFANSMLPKENMKKMKTFRVMNPLNAPIDLQVIDEFVAHQLKFIELLNASRSVSLNKTRISTSFASWIRMNLGDAFRFIVNHNLRHLKQIRTLQELV